MSCARHNHCAYTGTEPGLCAVCHASTAKCAGRHGRAPADGSWRMGAVAKPLNPVLHEGQPLHPREARADSSTCPQPPGHPSESEYAA